MGFYSIKWLCHLADEVNCFKNSGTDLAKSIEEPF